MHISAGWGNVPPLMHIGGIAERLTAAPVMRATCIAA
jgi:hypothetical protein